MLGMIFAHFGVALFLAGVLITEASSVESDLRFAPNETKTVGGLDFRFRGVERAQGPNYIADQGTVEVLRAGTVIATLHPQKRQYSGGGQMQTKSDIDPGLFRDLYVALGEPLQDPSTGSGQGSSTGSGQGASTGSGQVPSTGSAQGAWAVRVYVKPFVRWIWLGGLFMMFGGLVAATDRRFRALPDRIDAAKNATPSPSATQTHPHPTLPLKGRA
jgi:cytochrome c-type biogenesis protein CcmF